MVHGQQAEHDILAIVIEMDVLVTPVDLLRYAGDGSFVGEHDAFREAGGAGRVREGEDIIGAEVRVLWFEFDVVVFEEVVEGDGAGWGVGADADDGGGGVEGMEFGEGG